MGKKARIKWNYELIKDFIENNSDCKIISKEFKSVSDKIDILCGCKKPFETTFVKFKDRNKRMCNKCSRENVSKKTARSHDDFLKLLLEKRENFFDEYKIIGRYKNSKTKIDFLHINCNKIWSVLPDDLLKNRNCGHCNGNKEVSHREFVMKMYDKFKCEYSVLSIKRGYNDTVIIKHNNCGNIFEPTAYKILNETRCPKCANKKKGQYKKWNTKIFVKKSKEIHGDKFDYKNTKYVAYTTEVSMLCKKHKFEFTQTPANHLISIHCCPKCEKEAMSKENNPNYNPSLTDEERDFGRKLYNENGINQRTWANIIFELDNYKCVICNSGGRLNAHHINSWARYKDLRYDLNNGVTLCVKCHSANYEGSFHRIYGNNNFTNLDFYEFYQNKTGNVFNIKEIRNIT